MGLGAPFLNKQLSTYTSKRNPKLLAACSLTNCRQARTYTHSSSTPRDRPGAGDISSPCPLVIVSPSKTPVRRHPPHVPVGEAGQRIREEGPKLPILDLPRLTRDEKGEKSSPLRRITQKQTRSSPLAQGPPRYGGSHPSDEPRLGGSRPRKERASEEGIKGVEPSLREGDRRASRAKTGTCPSRV